MRGWNGEKLNKWRWDSKKDEIIKGWIVKEWNGESVKKLEGERVRKMRRWKSEVVRGWNS